MKRITARQANRSVITLVVFVAAFAALLWVSQSLSQSEQVQNIVADFGYLGVLIIGVIAGLNIFVPVPAATFTSVFLAAGLSLPLIIIALAVGTLIADFTSFFLGHLSRELMEKKHPKLFTFITNFQEKHSRWTYVLVLVYASFMPLPNELILIPLGLAGVRFKNLIIPLLIASIIHQIILVYGVIGLTQLFF